MQPSVYKLKTQLAEHRSMNGNIRIGVSMALLLSLLALAGCDGAKAAGPPPKPPEVEVVEVIQKDVPIQSDWTATLDGYVNANIVRDNRNSRHSISPRKRS